MAVADLGGNWGQLPPFHDENSAWRPLLARNAPLIMTLPHSFLTVLIRIWGETYKSRQYLVEKPKNFLNLESKNFCAPPPLFRSIIFLVPSLQVAPLQLRSGSAPEQTYFYKKLNI